MGGQVNIGGSWKDINGVYVNIGGVWKPASSINCNIDGLWKAGWNSWPSTITEDFAGTAGTAPNPAYFATSVAGGATVQLDGAGFCKINVPNSDQAGLLIVKNNIPKTTRTYGVKFKATVSTYYMRPLIIMESVSQPSVGLHADKTPLEKIFCRQHMDGRIEIIYRASGDGYKYYNGTSNQWETSETFAYAGAVNTIYEIVMETTATQFRFILKNSSGAVLKTTPWVNWTDTTLGTDPWWLCMGDYATDYNTGELYIDRYTES